MNYLLALTVFMGLSFSSALILLLLGTYTNIGEFKKISYGLLAIPVGSWLMAVAIAVRMAFL